MVGEKMCDKNLEQRINITFCVNIGKSPGETLALLTMAYDEYTMKKWNVLMAQGDQGRARGCARRPRRGSSCTRSD
jgi:hypothetical protein